MAVGELRDSDMILSDAKHVLEYSVKMIYATVLVGMILSSFSCSTAPSFYSVSFRNETDSRIDSIWLMLHERDESYYKDEKYSIKGLLPGLSTKIGVFSPSYSYVPGEVTVYWQYTESDRVESYSFNMNNLVTDKRNGEFIVDVYDKTAKVSFYGKEEYYAD